MNFFSHTKWALLWAMLIFILCAIPGKHIPFGGFWDVFHLDKLIHACLFFVQAVLFVQGFTRQSQLVVLNKYPKLISLLICIFYGAALELMQRFVFQDRSADVFDFIANSIGALAGVWFFQKMLNKYKAVRGSVEH